MQSLKGEMAFKPPFFKVEGVANTPTYKTRAMIGGIIGAIFTGLAFMAFTAKHAEIVQGDYAYLSYGYPEIGSICVIIASIGFVIMIVELAAKSENQK